MVVGLHGDSTALAVKAAAEEYNTNVESARTLHPKRAVNTAQDHLHCLVTVTHKHVLLMVIGLHGDSTANVPRVVEEAHSTQPEFAITRHPQAEANTVLDHLNKQTCAIPKGVLLMVIGLHGDNTASAPKVVEEAHSIE